MGIAAIDGAGWTNCTGATDVAGTTNPSRRASSASRMRPPSSTRLTLATTMRPSTEIGNRYDESVLSPNLNATPCMCQ
jgi:hypothetical protein